MAFSGASTEEDNLYRIYIVIARSLLNPIQDEGGQKAPLPLPVLSL